MSTTATQPTLPVNVNPEQREDAIRVRALEIFLARNGSGVWGDAMSDWLQAEREILPIEQDLMEAHSSQSAKPA